MNFTERLSRSRRPGWRSAVGLRLTQGLLPLLVGLSPVASALQVEPVVSTGLGYTSNARLTENNEDSEAIFFGLVGGSVKQSDGPLRVNADTSLTYQNYLGNAYGERHWFNLDLDADWAMIRDRVDWGVRDYFSQTPINNLSSDTPSNLENTNAFSLGPKISLPLSGRQTVSIAPLFTDFYYQNSNADNQQYGVTADWLYKLYSNMNIGLDGQAAAVRYNKSDLYPDYDRYRLSGVLDGRRPRSEYRIQLGGTTIDRDKTGTQNGFSGSLSYLYHITGHSSFRTYASTDLTDSSQQYLSSQIDPATGDYTNVQTSGDVIRNKIVRLTYLRTDSTLNSNVWVELRKVDYKESPDDREVGAIGAAFDYQVTPLFKTGVYGSYNKTKETDTNTDYDNYRTGVTAGYRLSRKLGTRLDLQYQKKDSSIKTDQYTEYSAFLGLVYGFGQTPGFSSGYHIGGY